MSLNSTQRPIRQKHDLICEDVLGECVIYDGRQKKAHHLNSTLTWIWNRCDGETTVEALVTAFDKQFNVTNGNHVVLTGLQQLNAHDLLENQSDISDVVAAERTSVSRRAVVVGGSVLMPLLTSIVAPTPAAAKSPNPPRGSGNNNGNGKRKR